MFRNDTLKGRCLKDEKSVQMSTRVLASQALLTNVLGSPDYNWRLIQEEQKGYS